MTIKPLGYVIAVALAASSLQAGLFVGPGTATGTAFSSTFGEALVFKVTSDIQITAVSAYADGGTLGSSVNVQIRDYNNTLLGGTVVTTSSPVVGSVWATETLGSPLTLSAGTYSISGFGTFSFDFGNSTHATYSGGGAVTAYDNYYDSGSPSQSVIFAGTGTAALPNPGAGFTALGDPKLSVVNFDFTPVPEPSTYALVGGLALVGFGLYRRQVSK